MTLMTLAIYRTAIQSIRTNTHKICFFKFKIRKGKLKIGHRDPEFDPNLDLDLDFFLTLNLIQTLPLLPCITNCFYSSTMMTCCRPPDAVVQRQTLTPEM